MPIERTVLGGFSQGAVMTYALGLGSGRPTPAGLIALSGFIPTVAGLSLDLEADGPPGRDRARHARSGHRHRVRARRARPPRRRRADVLYRESPMSHTIDTDFIAELRDWLLARIPSAAS